MFEWSIGVFCGIGVDGKKVFLTGLMLPRAAGDANENDRALTGDMRAGPITDEGVVGPTLGADVSVKVRCHGLRESKWWDTVKENLEEEHEPILAVGGTREGSNRRDEARGYAVKSLNSNDSSKSSDDITMVIGDSSTNGLTPFHR